MIEINMKWVVRIVILLYMVYKTVYGGRIEPGLSIEPIKYDEEGYLKVGTRLSVVCKGTHKNQRLIWADPSGKTVERIHSNRVFAQEHFMTGHKGRAPGLVLTVSDLMVSDAGVYQCRSGELRRNVSVCVIKPLEFVDTDSEITTEIGRSITLSCQAKGEPEPRIIWNRNGEELTEETSNSKYKVNTKYNSQGFEGLLTITSLEAEDSGPYSCVALQDSPMLDECHHEDHFNITLYVNHAPQFENANETKLVYGKMNHVVHLPCSANGYPLPSYRWFKDEGRDTLYEYENKQVTYSEQDNQAVLTVTASHTTFGQRYICKATNSLGEAEKSFVLLKMEKPRKASEVNVVKSTDTQIDFNITWFDDILFPIDGFDIQYIESTVLKRSPKEPDWRKATEIRKEYDDGVASENDEGIFVSLDNLDEDTNYWVRLRAVNDAGDAPWSDPIQAETDIEDEEIGGVAEQEVEREGIIGAVTGPDGIFYGVFFFGTVIVLAIGCMFAMRYV